MSQQLRHDTEDKTWWCRHGESLEHEFIERFGAQLGLDINPQKKTDQYTHDLICADGTPADLKTQTEPFWTAERYKFHPESTLTLNGKDINRYKELYPNLIIYFWQNFAGGTRFQKSVPHIEAVYKASLSEIIELVDAGYSNYHEYKRRKGDGANAQHSYLIDTKLIKQVYP